MIRLIGLRIRMRTHTVGSYSKLQSRNAIVDLCSQPSHRLQCTVTKNS